MSGKGIQDDFKLALRLSEEMLVALNFRINDDTPEEPVIFAKNEIQLTGKMHLDVYTTFHFEDIGFEIKGTITRAIDIEITEQNTDEHIFDIEEFVENEKKELIVPLLSKASKIVADITDDAYMFPLFIPPTEWMEHETSEIQIINKLKTI